MMSFCHWMHYTLCNLLQEKDIQTYDYFETVEVCAIFVPYLFSARFQIGKEIKRKLRQLDNLII